MLQSMFYVLQSMFYVFGSLFFLSSIFVLIFTTGKEFMQAKTDHDKENLRSSIRELLAKVPDELIRKKASDVFAQAKTLDALQKVKARLVTIILTGEK